ncbi:MAG: tyrosine-type recombinase/integrase, partial [Victivallales bacterium]|nr:tyrosine-type recombinase/integrase [Victivallales bacterium]
VLFPGDAAVEVVLRSPDQYRKPYVPGEAVAEGMAVCLFIRDAGDRRTKTGLERIVPVAAKLLPVLDRRLEKADGKAKALFPFALDDRGAIFGRAWLKGAKKVHAELTMHGFRHFAASEMENNGVNRSVSGAVLGHVDSSVHGGYVHVMIAALKEAVDRVW